jgi:tetratricopeptide (TPR) repeat protein
MRFNYKYFYISLILIFASLRYSYSQEDTNNAEKGYAYLNQGNTKEAIASFEKHISKYPEDTKISLQLSYAYLQIGNQDKAKKYLQYVKDNSKDTGEISAAEKQLESLHQNKSEPVKLNFVDLYSFNFYDSHQDNVIANLVVKYNNRIFDNSLFGGVYMDVYTDTRSNENNILNDRFVEAGGFLRYVIFPSLSFEVRAGYVREMDYNKNSFNFKPILMYSDKFSTENPGTNFYLNVYSAGLYDHKFKNIFGQLSLFEAASIPVGSSRFEPYIRQALLGDTKRFSYNNFYEVGGGVQFVLGSMYLPTIFLEGTEKFYFTSDQKSTFQIKAGFLINFYKFVW